MTLFTYLFAYLLRVTYRIVAHSLGLGLARFKNANVSKLRLHIKPGGLGLGLMVRLWLGLKLGIGLWFGLKTK